jgi:hypothetical protein
MDTRSVLRITIALACSIGAHGQRAAAGGEDMRGDRILHMSEAEQIAYVNSDLSKGMPVDQYGPLGMLVLNRSSLVLPMLERKIEEVLRSPTPLDCFTDKTVDPSHVVDLAAATIAYAGDEEALKEISKLIALDEKRFGMLVRNTLVAAQNRRNPFVVAYGGLEIGDPATDKRIAEWIGPQFDGGYDDSEFRQAQLRRWWADAMLEKYGRAPNEANWADDPIASRIKPELAASLRSEILQLAAEAFEKRPKK